MGKIQTVTVTFKDIEYYLLVQVKESGDILEYHITAITESDIKVYGDFVFAVNHGFFCIVNKPNIIAPELTEVIVASIKEQLL